MEPFCPDCFILPGPLAFRPGGIGKAALGASQLGTYRTPTAPSGQLTCPHTRTHTSSHPLAQEPGSQETISGLPGQSPASLQPSPISASLHKPQTHSNFKASSPRWVFQKLFPFQCQAGHSLLSDVGQGTMREFCNHRKIQVVETKWDSRENEPETGLEVNSKAGTTFLSLRAGPAPPGRAVLLVKVS